MAGPNSASPHYNTGDRVIQAGDAVIFDWGGELNGYLSDMTRTVVIGEPSDEQRGAEPEVLAQLAELNSRYEERFGFRFVVWVDRRTRAELLPVLRERLERTREEELETGLRELVAIARDRWRRAG